MKIWEKKREKQKLKAKKWEKTKEKKKKKNDWITREGENDPWFNYPQTDILGLFILSFGTRTQAYITYFAKSILIKHGYLNWRLFLEKPNTHFGWILNA